MRWIKRVNEIKGKGSGLGKGLVERFGRGRATIHLILIEAESYILPVGHPYLRTKPLLHVSLFLKWLTTELSFKEIWKRWAIRELAYYRLGWQNDYSHILRLVHRGQPGLIFYFINIKKQVNLCLYNLCFYQKKINFFDCSHY